MAPSSSIEVRKLTPHIGAEILGIDLTEELEARTFELVREALLENLVIFFRDQEITVEQHKRFGRRFGEFHIHPGEQGLPGHPEIIVIHADEKSKRIAGEDWHSDVSCDPAPPMGSILHIVEQPAVGGDTMFASMYKAYESLSDDMKRFLCGLTAVHDGEHQFRGRYGYDDSGKAYPKSEHPVVRTHPVTGRRALFVNRIFTSRIVQLSKLESDAILQCLFRHIESPAFHCRFQWRKNSIAFWDNRCAQHQAIWDYFPNRRHGRRVTIQGDKPFFRA